MTLVQLGTLFAVRPAPYYLFFSAIEIATTATIVVLAAIGSRSTAQVSDRVLTNAA